MHVAEQVAFGIVGNLLCWEQSNDIRSVGHAVWQEIITAFFVYARC